MLNNMVAFSKGYPKNLLRYNKIQELKMYYGHWLKEIPDEMLEFEYQSAIWMNTKYSNEVHKKAINKETRKKAKKVSLSPHKKRRTKQMRVVSKNKHGGKRRPSRALHKGRTV
jgi:hypothetical protein